MVRATLNRSSKLVENVSGAISVLNGVHLFNTKAHIQSAAYIVTNSPECKMAESAFDQEQFDEELALNTGATPPSQVAAQQEEKTKHPYVSIDARRWYIIFLVRSQMHMLW